MFGSEPDLKMDDKIGKVEPLLVVTNWSFSNENDCCFVKTLFLDAQV